MRRLKILVWHVHGGYLSALMRVDHDWYLPVKPDRSAGYVGRGHTFDLPDYVREVPAEQVRDLDLDAVIFQSPQNYERDQFEVLSPRQQRLPKIYLEHNTPRPHPVETKHLIDDPDVLLVHVTQYNRLMWDNGRTPSVVIEHSVAIDPTIAYSGTLARGISVVNGMPRRGRLAGHDLFLQARRSIPLDIAGMETEQMGGLGDIAYRDLHRRVATYRFLFSPMRYSSLPLAVVEALTIGMPIVALATTELPSVIVDGESGFISCDPEVLLRRMKALVEDRELALRMGRKARALAQERFSLERFVRDWNAALALVTGAPSGSVVSASTGGPAPAVTAKTGAATKGSR